VLIRGKRKGLKIIFLLVRMLMMSLTNVVLTYLIWIRSSVFLLVCIATLVDFEMVLLMILLIFLNSANSFFRSELLPQLLQR
jgi:hypothetical protein